MHSLINIVYQMDFYKNLSLEHKRSIKIYGKGGKQDEVKIFIIL